MSDFCGCDLGAITRDKYGTHFHCGASTCKNRHRCMVCPTTPPMPDPTWVPTKMDLILGNEPPKTPRLFYGMPWYGLAGFLWGVGYCAYSFGTVFYVLWRAFSESPG